MEVPLLTLAILLFLLQGAQVSSNSFEPSSPKGLQWVIRKLSDRKWLQDCTISLHSNNDNQESLKNILRALNKDGKVSSMSKSLHDTRSKWNQCNLQLVHLTSDRPRETLSDLFQAFQKKWFTNDNFVTLLLIEELTLVEFQIMVKEIHETLNMTSNPLLYLWFPYSHQILITKHICQLKQPTLCLREADFEGMTRKPTGSILSGEQLDMATLSLSSTRGFAFGKEALQMRFLKELSQKDGFNIRWYEKPADYQPNANPRYSFRVEAVDTKMSHGALGIPPYTSLAAIFDFSQISHSAPLYIFSHTPPKLPQWNAVFRPFELPVWSMTFASILLYATFALLLNQKFCLSAFSDAMLVAIQPILSQSVHSRYARSRMRAAVFLWDICAFILLAGYSGVIVSHLTNPIRQAPLDTFQQLIDSDYYTYTVPDLRTYELIKISKWHPWKGLYLKLLTQGPKEANVLAPTDFGELMTHPDKVIVQEYVAGASILTSRFSHQGRTFLRASKEGSGFSPQTIGFTEGSALVELFNDRIRRFTVSGLIDKYKRDIVSAIKEEDDIDPKIKSYIEKIAGERSKVDPLNLENFEGAIMVASMGIVFALTIFVGEILFSYQMSPKGLNKTQMRMEHLI